MSRTPRCALALAVALGAFLGAARAGATPSTEIWIPSVDVQAFLVPHLNFDTYVRTRAEPDGTRKPPLWLFGPTIGVLPWQKVQLEIGFDLIWQGIEALDKYPIYFHGKLGTPEDAWFKWSPALVAGVYNVGVKSDLTTQNIVYGLLGRTFPVVGRLSGGYWYGNSELFIDEQGRKANHGALAAWDRTMKEITPKLWLCVDYQGSASWIGAVNFGFAWAFTDNISMIFAYDLYTNRTKGYGPTGTPFLVPGRDTFTVQLDINLDRLVKSKPAPAASAPAAPAPSP
ncbi:MAG TPA: hypothetical protein VGQ83_35395 [Polyangia bacterium]|jgi:hypothetical protein